MQTHGPDMTRQQSEPLMKLMRRIQFNQSPQQLIKDTNHSSTMSTDYSPQTVSMLMEILTVLVWK